MLNTKFNTLPSVIDPEFNTSWGKAVVNQDIINSGDPEAIMNEILRFHDAKKQLDERDNAWKKITSFVDTQIMFDTSVLHVMAANDDIVILFNQVLDMNMKIRIPVVVYNEVRNHIDKGTSPQVMYRIKRDLDLFTRECEREYYDRAQYNLDAVQNRMIANFYNEDRTLKTGRNYNSINDLKIEMTAYNIMRDTGDNVILVTEDKHMGMAPGLWADETRLEAKFQRWSYNDLINQIANNKALVKMWDL